MLVLPRTRLRLWRGGEVGEDTMILGLDLLAATAATISVRNQPEEEPGPKIGMVSLDRR